MFVAKQGVEQPAIAGTLRPERSLTQFSSKGDRCGCILAIAVRSYISGVLGSHWRATDQNFDLIADASASQRFDRCLHSRHRDREQGGKTDNVGILFLYRIDEPVGRHIGTEIGYFEASALQHGGNQVLPYIVQIPFYSADDDAACWLGPAFCQKRRKNCDRRFHRPAG